MDETQLRHKARQSIESGRLPLQRPGRMWGGPGSGAACAVCADTIGPDQLGFELEFPQAPEVASVSHFYLHVRCFAAWELERDDLQLRNDGKEGVPIRAHLNGDALRLLEGSGTIANRESDYTVSRRGA